MSPSVRDYAEAAGNKLLRPLGYVLQDRVLLERPEGFPGYLDGARKAGMDVNDYEEQVLGWRLPEPTLQEVLYPYLEETSAVCEIGPGTGRWSRHILKRIPRGQLHLVDPSPWMVRFLNDYFSASPNVRAHVNDGLRLPFAEPKWLDFIFSANTFVELKLGMIREYALDFHRVLKPGGRAIFDYIDPTTEEGWEHLQTQPTDLATVYTFHAPETIDRVMASAGFDVQRRFQVGKSTYVICRALER